MPREKRKDMPRHIRAFFDAAEWVRLMGPDPSRYLGCAKTLESLDST